MPTKENKKQREHWEHGRPHTHTKTVLETYPNGNKTTPQTQHTIRLDCFAETIDKAIVYFGVGGLIHEFGTQHVPGCDRDGHEEARDKGGTKGRADIFAGPTRGLGHVPLGQVVTAHFGGVEDAGPGNVDLDAAVKASDPLVTVHVADQGSEPE